MQKTKMGISVGLMGAGLYFMGLLNFLVLIILAGYVLLFEDNQWLRRSAVKAVVVVVSFALVSVVFSFGNDIFGFINGFLSWFKATHFLSWPLNLNGIISSAANALEKVILVILAFKAFIQGSLAIGPIDKVVDKNM